MTEKKPVGLMVFGILNIILGALGLFCSMCGLAAQLATPFLQDAQAQQLKAAQPPKGTAPPNVTNFDTQELTKKLQERLDSELPMNTGIKIGQQAVSIVLAVVLIISGIALLRARPSARILCILFAVGAILLQLFSMTYYFLMEKPVMDEFLANDLPKETPPFMVAMMGAGGTIGMVVGAAIGMGYALILLIYVLMPSTGKALAVAGPSSSVEDYRDPGYQPPDNR